ncbi:hypothetical protein BJV77DRAFT_597207 [Russula vinacea]|nr:hypothetical protein BJV77DRAFT_597207 [Russula vinacea]
MSSSSVKTLSLVRTVTFATTLLFSLIVLALSGDFVSLIPASQYNTFAALALFTALITLLTVTPMLVIDLYRQGSFFSYIVVEIAWLSFLCVFWLACASDAASVVGLITAANSKANGSVCGVLTGTCGEMKAIMAFSFLLWILLMAYSITLLALAIRAHQRGNSAWRTSVRDGVFFYPSKMATTGGAAQVYGAPAAYPLTQPQPQQFTTYSHANPQVPPSVPYAVPQVPSSISYAAPQLPSPNSYAAPQLPSSISYATPQLPSPNSYAAPQLPSSISYATPQV